VPDTQVAAIPEPSIQNQVQGMTAKELDAKLEEKKEQVR